MSGESTAPHPQPMEGHGAYERNSRVQGAGSVPAIALLAAAAREAPLPGGDGPLTIADYGSATGGNSLAPIAAALEALRARAAARAVNVVHTDLPGNDFSTLFRVLGEEPHSYMRGDPAVFPSAVGRSFYGQILPAGSVWLGWSSWAVQWLSRVPAEIPDQVQVAFSRDDNAREAFARQAAEDWRTFLEARARELQPGGRLVVLTMASGDDGAFGYGPLLEAMFDTLTQMVGSGFVDAQAVRRMAIPTVGRSRAEFAAPFGPGGVAGLSLTHLDIFEAEDRIFAQYAADGDAEAFGARWAAFSRASVFPTLAAALDGGEGNSPTTNDFMDRLEAGMRTRLSRAPAPMRMPLAEMVIEKTAPPAR
ncbi:class I SAM-dependent methyltransferase [Roseixanthobacter liquoris]|uniref:hypothetical protein n=1 Tax=Roseixanthobacter liquoris TaxID=3119921 RepID=UPI0037293D69